MHKFGREESQANRVPIVPNKRLRLDPECEHVLCLTRQLLKKRKREGKGGEGGKERVRRANFTDFLEV